MSKIKGKPTEAVIRGNPHPQWELSRLKAHIGNARETFGQWQGAPGFALIDSCHEDWFAQWYIETVFPRVQGIAIVQDIAFADCLEGSTEATYVWQWLTEQAFSSQILGQVELELARQALRVGYAERYLVRSNSILLDLPTPQPGALPQFIPSPESLLEQAQSLVSNNVTKHEADELLNQAMSKMIHSPNHGTGHRLCFQAGDLYRTLGNATESRLAFSRGLGIALQSTPQIRSKRLVECFEFALARGQYQLTLQALLLMLTEPSTWLRSLRRVPLLSRAALRKLSRRT